MLPGLPEVSFIWWQVAARLPFPPTPSLPPSSNFPRRCRQASEAYRAGDVEKALSLYPAIEPMRSFVALPKCNVTEEFLNFADAYRQTRKYAEAEALLRSLNFGENKEAPLRATLIRAFIFCDKNETAKAEALMKDFPRTNPEDLNFPLDRIVRTRIFLANGKFHEAALEAGEAVAITRIEAPVYPESLYLAAACYEKMGEVVEKQKAGRDRTESEKIIDETVDYRGRQQVGAAAIGAAFLKQLLGEERTRQRRGVARRSRRRKPQVRPKKRIPLPPAKEQPAPNCRTS